MKTLRKKIVRKFNYLKNLQKAILSLVFLTMVSFASTAQNAYSVSGSLLNASDSKPLEFANVAIHKLPDSTFVKGSVTDANGIFRIIELAPGKYFLKVSFLGFTPFTKTGIELTEEKPELDLGKFELAEKSKEISEAVIVGERLKSVDQVDRTVYTLNEQSIKSSNTGVDVLKKIPMISSDMQNNISLRGSRNILILVDGKERNKDYLSSIAPSSIEKIEIMNNPSAKYDGAIDGVINVILKKEKKVGLNAMIDYSLPVNDNMFTFTNTNIELGYYKVRFYAFNNLNYYKIPYNSTTNREYPNSTDNNAYQQIINSDYIDKYTSTNVGADIFFNDKNTLNLSTSFNPYNVSNSEKWKTQFSSNGNTYNQYYTKYEWKDKSNGNNYSAYYKHLFGNPGNEITLDASYYTYDGKKNNTYHDYNQEYYTDTEIQFLPARIEINNNQRESAGIKLDYTQILKKTYRLETGYQGYYQWMHSNQMVNDVETQKYNYNDFRHSAYLTIAANYKKLGWSAGLRAEESLIDMNDTANAEYLSILPNLSLFYKLKDNLNLKLSYHSSVIRPDMGNLNPISNFVDSATIRYGNPNLKPQQDHYFAFNVNYNFKNNYICPELFVKYGDKVFQEINVLNNNNITEITPQNIGNNIEYGLGLASGFQLAKWWNINMYTRFAQKENLASESSEVNLPANHQFSFMVSFNSTMTIWKNMNIFTGFYYSSPVRDFQVYSKREPFYYLSFEKEIVKNLKLGLNWFLPFHPKFVVNNTKIESESYKQTNFTYVKVPFAASIKLAYNFNYGKEVKRLNVNKSGDAEKKKSVF